MIRSMMFWPFPVTFQVLFESSRAHPRDHEGHRIDRKISPGLCQWTVKVKELLLQILTLLLIVSECSRMIPISSNFLWRKLKFISHSKFCRLYSFQYFSIGRIVVLLLDSIMYESMGLGISHYHQAMKFCIMQSSMRVNIDMVSF